MQRKEKRPSPNPVRKARCSGPSPASTRGVYRARRPRESPLWRLLKDHLDEFLGVSDDRFAPAHDPLRTVIPGAARKFLNCGILDFGFARIRCPECGDEFLLAKETIEKLFRHWILHMFKNEEAIDDAVVESMLAWHHTGFGAHVGLEIAATDAAGRRSVKPARGREWSRARAGGILP